MECSGISYHTYSRSICHLVAGVIIPLVVVTVLVTLLYNVTVQSEVFVEGCSSCFEQTFDATVLHQLPSIYFCDFDFSQLFFSLCQAKKGQIIASDQAILHASTM